MRGRRRGRRTGLPTATATGTDASSQGVTMAGSLVCSKRGRADGAPERVAPISTRSDTGSLRGTGSRDRDSTAQVFDGPGEDRREVPGRSRCREVSPSSARLSAIDRRITEPPPRSRSVDVSTRGGRRRPHGMARDDRPMPTRKQVSLIGTSEEWPDSTPYTLSRCRSASSPDLRHDKVVPRRRRGPRAPRSSRRPVAAVTTATQRCGHRPADRADRRLRSDLGSNDGDRDRPRPT